MEKDLYKEYLFFRGEDTIAYDYFGVSLKRSAEYFEYTFRVFAKEADSVALISDFTDWDNGLLMEKGEKGIFYLKIQSECSLEGKRYKYLVKKGERSVKKGDPYARRSMGYDDGASVIYCEEDFRFTDGEYLRKRRSLFKKKGGHYLSCPINIYEVHLESFYKKEDGSFPGSISNIKSSDGLCGLFSHLLTLQTF